MAESKLGELDLKVQSTSCLKYGEVVKAIHAQGTHTSTTATKDAPHILSYLPNLYLETLSSHDVACREYLISIEAHP
jgi:hypothetical protein